jgi:hypothetical protein
LVFKKKLYLLGVTINRVEYLKRCGRCMFKISIKISSCLEMLKKTLRSFCVQVLIWGWFKRVWRSPIFIKPSDLKFWELKVTCFSKLQPIFRSIQIYMWIVEAWNFFGDGNLHQRGFQNKSLQMEPSQKEYKGRSLELLE